MPVVVALNCKREFKPSPPSSSNASCAPALLRSANVGARMPLVASEALSAQNWLSSPARSVIRCQSWSVSLLMRPAVEPVPFGTPAMPIRPVAAAVAVASSTEAVRAVRLRSLSRCFRTRLRRGSTARWWWA